MRRHYYRCCDCLVPMVLESDRRPSPLPVCVCGGTLEYMGVVHRHRVLELEDRSPCDDRCTGATGPNCDCQCGGENHGSGRVITVVRADHGAATVVALDPEVQIARAKEWRDAKDRLTAAIQSCRLASSFRDYAAGVRVGSSAFLEIRHVAEKRSHAKRLKTHNGRIRAIDALIEHVKTL